MGRSVVDAPIRFYSARGGMPSHGGVSQAFQEMATILETLETTETDVEITSATPVDDELLATETVSLEVSVTVPFLDSELSDTTTLRPEAVSLQDDGRLDVEFQATVDGSRATEGIHPDSTGQPQGGESRPKPNAMAMAADDESRFDCVSASQSETQSTKPTDENETGDDDSESNGGDATIEEDGPAYRDPEQLREVYETYETFAEMTDALDVNVTAQTVRRYMIEYDIHQPASHTGSQSAETLLEADPDSISSSASDQAGEASDPPAASMAHATPQSTTSVDEEPSSRSTTGETETSSSDSDSAELNPHNSPSDEETHDEKTEEPDDLGSDVEAIATDGGVQPESNSRAGDCPSDNTLDDQAIAETIGLPSHLTLDQVKKVVQDAKTLYEAQQHLELDRDCTRSLLETLDLLELVHGRLATRDRYNQTIAEIDRRILAATR